jgi:hypothetical protein
MPQRHRALTHHEPQHDAKGFGTCAHHVRSFPRAARERQAAARLTHGRAGRH